MSVIKNLENKIKLVMIVCMMVIGACVVICLGTFFMAKGMVDDAHKKVYVLDGTVPILVQRSTMDETLDVEAKSRVETFHHLFFTFDSQLCCGVIIVHWIINVFTNVRTIVITG